MSKRKATTTQFGPDFLQALAPDVHLRLTSGAAKALHNCQEEFVSKLVQYLQKETTNDSDDKGKAGGQQRQIQMQPHHIEKAMTELGLLRIFEQAQKQQQAQDDDHSGKRRKKAPKNQKYTAAMEAEQERLLQLSKEKALQQSTSSTK
jgi:hypothetical protein